MKQKQPVLAARILLIVGLMVVIIALLISRYLKLPDFFAGTITGFGIGLELVAAWKISKIACNKQTDITG